MSDGAAVAILTRADRAREFTSNPIYIKSLAVSVGPCLDLMTQDYDYAHIEENVRAAKMAYAEAGIKDPRKELSVAEVHDCFTIHEMVLYQDLGWTTPDRVKEDIEGGASRPERRFTGEYGWRPQMLRASSGGKRFEDAV